MSMLVEKSKMWREVWNEYEGKLKRNVESVEVINKGIPAIHKKENNVPNFLEAEVDVRNIEYCKEMRVEDVPRVWRRWGYG